MDQRSGIEEGREICRKKWKRFPRHNAADLLQWDWMEGRVASLAKLYERIASQKADRQVWLFCRGASLRGQSPWASLVRLYFFLQAHGLPQSDYLRVALSTAYTPKGCRYPPIQALYSNRTLAKYLRWRQAYGPALYKPEPNWVEAKRLEILKITKRLIRSSSGSRLFRELSEAVGSSAYYSSCSSIQMQLLEAGYLPHVREDVKVIAEQVGSDRGLRNLIREMRKTVEEMWQDSGVAVAEERDLSWCSLVLGDESIQPIRSWWGVNAAAEVNQCSGHRISNQAGNPTRSEAQNSPPLSPLPQT